MLYQASLRSPSSGGLEDVAAVHGDASQLHGATLCSPSREEPVKVTLTSNAAC